MILTSSKFRVSLDKNKFNKFFSFSFSFETIRLFLKIRIHIPDPSHLKEMPEESRVFIGHS